MDAVYENSCLTILASNTKSAHDGFLSMRREPSYTKLPTLISGGGWRIVSLALPHSYTYSDDSAFDRCWTSQEYHLSNRLLVFRQSEAHWTCRADISLPVRKSHLIHRGDMLLS